MIVLEIAADYIFFGLLMWIGMMAVRFRRKNDFPSWKYSFRWSFSIVFLWMFVVITFYDTLVTISQELGVQDED